MLSVLLPALLRLGLLAIVCIVIGFVFGVVPALAVVIAGLVILLAIHMTYATRLADWLESPVLDRIPNGWGLWSDVFARLYRQRRATEINERRLLENEERFRRTISALPEGIVLVDASLQIDWCNPVAEQHLGVRLSADQGLRVTNLVRDPEFVAYLTSAHFESPLMFRPLARPGVALEIRVVDFEPARSIIITRDITQRERVDAVRRDFIANVSHELRTPLTVVTGFLEMLRDAEPEDVATRQHHLGLMHEQAQRMTRLVEDLLTLSRLESRENPVPDDVVDLRQLVREVGDEARALSSGRHRISIAAPVAFARGSRDELRSAFGNLVLERHSLYTGGRSDLAALDRRRRRGPLRGRRHRHRDRARASFETDRALLPGRQEPLARNRRHRARPRHRQAHLDASFGPIGHRL